MPRIAQLHLESIEKDDINRHIKTANLPDQIHFYHAMLFFEDETIILTSLECAYKQGFFN